MNSKISNDSRHLGLTSRPFFLNRVKTMVIENVTVGIGARYKKAFCQRMEHDRDIVSAVISSEY